MAESGTYVGFTIRMLMWIVYLTKIKHKSVKHANTGHLERQENVL